MVINFPFFAEPPAIPVTAITRAGTRWVSSMSSAPFNGAASATNAARICWPAVPDLRRHLVRPCARSAGDVLIKTSGHLLSHTDTEGPEDLIMNGGSPAHHHRATRRDAKRESRRAGRGGLP